MRQLGKSRGFTLTELLVATAIFSIMMTAIVTLFVASLRAVKSAYLAADAYETSRGAFNVVERDLSTVFTMRDYGDYYQFFGTPQGMVMVGLIREADGNTTLGRITYVIYPVVIKTTGGGFVPTYPFSETLDNNGTPFDYTDDTKTDQVRPVPIQILNDNGTPATADDTVDDVFVGTAALVRYIEPGVQDLDTYPFDWNVLFTDPEFGTTIKDELDDAIRDDLGVPQDSSDPDVLVRLDAVRRELLAAKKRELWIRMLSGQEYWVPLLNGGAPQLPDVWGRRDLSNPNPATNVLIQSLLQPFDSNGNQNALDPRDYVVAENIGLVTPMNGANRSPLYPMQFNHVVWDPIRSANTVLNPNAAINGQTRSNFPFTPYVIVAGTLSVTTYMNEVFVGTTSIPVTPATSLADLAGALDAIPGIEAYLSDVPDTSGGARVEIEVKPELVIAPPITRWSFAFGEDTSGILQELGLYCQFFRYGRARPSTTLDLRAKWNSDVSLPGDEYIVGNALTPRLPAVVALRLPFAYERPYPTAPQFERNLEQIIDVPTAYTRMALFGQ